MQQVSESEIQRRQRWVKKASMIRLTLGKLRIDGAMLSRMALAKQPTATECRTWLRELQLEFGSERLLGAILGVGRETARAWLRGKRRPCSAARRLIWTVRAAWDGQFEEELSLWDWMFWQSGADPAPETAGGSDLPFGRTDGVAVEARPRGQGG